MPFTAATVPAYRVAQTISGNAPFRKTHIVTSGQTVTAGRFCYLTTAGAVTPMADPGVAITGLSEATIVGDGTVTVSVVYANDDVIFSGAGIAGTFVTADIGDAVTMSPTGLNLDTTTNGTALLHGADTTDSGRVLFTVLQASLRGAPGGVITS